MHPFRRYLVALVVLAACNSPAHKAEPVAVPMESKSPQAHPIDSVKQGGIAPDKQGGIGSGTEDKDTERDPKDVLADLLQSYDKVIRVDTTVLLGARIIHIKLTYRCLKDSAINVPARYLEPYQLGQFVAHNFVTDLTVWMNDSVVTDRTISKKDFSSTVYPNVAAYGSLMFPYFKRGKSHFIISYSLTIPLTDVGLAVHAAIDSTGAVNYMGEVPDDSL